MQNLLNLEILTKTFDDLPNGVGIFQVVDLNDIKSIRYVFMNKVVLYEMRKKREEVFGKRIIEVAPEAYEHEIGLQIIETYRKIATEGGSINLGLVEYSNHMVAGTYELSVHHIQDNYIYVMLRNVTELERTKNELELKNMELNQFAHRVAHDIKEPVRTIASFTKLIEEKYKGKLDKKAEEYLNLISVASNRMRILIDDLLEYSVIGKQDKMIDVDCRKLVEEIQQDLQIKIRDTNSTIEIGELPIVKGYETELRLLFQNLISNGIKFSKSWQPSKIKIHAEERDGWTFIIQDNGIGIADQHKNKIFGIFQRLHNRNEYEGTGIGLAYCKKIAELHKGDIWVDSELDEGSTFYFSIPNQL